MPAPIPATLERSVDIAASPAEVWGIVSDVRRTPEWSPECRKVLVFGHAGQVVEGAQLIGINRLRWAIWPTRSVVTAVEPERRIAWRVRTSGARWSYELEPIAGEAGAGAGTRLTERREGGDGVPVVALTFTRLFLGGVSGHSDELDHHIGQSLERIKAIAEKGANARQ